MPTCQQMRDYFDWQCQIGRGSWPVTINEAVLLCSKLVCQYVGIAIPEHGKEADTKAKKVFLNPVLDRSFDA